MKNKIIISSSLLLTIFLSACGGGGSAPEQFSEFTSNTFQLPAENKPVEVDFRNFVYDVNEDDAAFDFMMQDNEYAV